MTSVKAFSYSNTYYIIKTPKLAENGPSIGIMVFKVNELIGAAK